MTSATAATEARPPGGLSPIAARCAAVGALAVAALHLWAATAHHHHAFFAVVMGTMAATCTACSLRCLRRPCQQETTLLLGMSAAMAMAHVAWLLAGAGHHHAALPDDGAGHAAAGLTMLGLAFAEVGVAGLCALALRRHSSMT
jgi:hypothetical protein